MTAPRPFRDLLTLAAIYVAIIACTHYAYFGDTLGYVQDILRFDHDPVSAQKTFWDFGHLFWRPLGWLLFRTFEGFFSYTRTGESHLTVTVLLMAANIVSGFVAFVLFRALAGRFLYTAWESYLVAASLVCFHAFLNYVQTGSSYITGLMWLTLSAWAAVSATQNNSGSRVYCLASGAGAALAVLFWLPYVLALPGIIVVLFLWPPSATKQFEIRNRLRLALVTLASTTILLFAGLLIPLISLHIHSLSELVRWAVASGHGSAPNRRLLRLGSGLPRSFVWIGNEGTLIKRYLLHDPYSPVSLSQIVVQQLWRMALFYVAAACMLLVLLRSTPGRRLSVIFASAAIPVLLFAVLIFEPGSIERYFPIYPFLCLAIAYCVSRYKQNRVPVAAIIAFLSITTLLNVTALWRSSIMAQHRPTEARALSLTHKVGSRGMIAVVSLMDDLYQLSAFFPFDPVVRTTSLPVYDVVVAGNARSLTWKPDFARRAFESLNEGEAVWISKRLLATRPESSWEWNEGDDPHFTWPELPALFQQFDYADDVGGRDGFLLLANSPHNRDVLNRLLGH